MDIWEEYPYLYDVQGEINLTVSIALTKKENG